MLSRVQILTLMLKVMIKILKVGDHVRILQYKNIFAKDYNSNWSE